MGGNWIMKLLQSLSRAPHPKRVWGHILPLVFSHEFIHRLH